MARHAYFFILVAAVSVGCGEDATAAGVTSFGMGSGASSGDLRFTHAGGLDTYSSFSIMFPADRSSVVLLCNFNGSNNTNVFANFVLGIRSLMLGAQP